MAMPVGATRAASQAAGWTVAGCAAAFTLFYLAEVKEAAHPILGLPRLAASQQQSTTKPTAASPRHSGRTVALQAGPHGHYHANAEINGQRIEAMVDTGASQVALTF